MEQNSYHPTIKQLEALRLIATWSDGKPRAQRLADRLGLTDANTVRSRLKPLEAHGYLQRHREAPGYPEDLIVTPSGMLLLGLSAKPPGGAPIKGSSPADVEMYPIKCGPMTPALSEGEWISDVAGILPGFSPGDYLLEADGDSMVGPVDAESIYPGDRIHCRPDLAPANGETVHAQYLKDNGEPECALGIFHVDDNTGIVTLSKLNPTYSPITRPGEGVFVHGIVINVVRRLRTSNRK